MTLPLQGIRVVDLTMMWAGPYATKLLADMGAEVVKIESPRHTDNIRAFVVPDRPWEKPWNRSAYFNEYNRNKLGVALDLSTEKGRAVFVRLVAASDVVIENYRADVMENLGFTYERLCEAKPDIIYVSMPGYGKSGPDRDLVGYGPSIEEMAGLASLNGDPDGRPLKTGISYGDPMAGVMAAGAVCAALIQRDQTGFGQYIEVAQRDVMVGVIPDALMEWQMNAREPERLGNRDPLWAPQGCYPCLPLADSEARQLIEGGTSAERWITLTVTSDEEWLALCDLIGRPDLATLTLRHEHHDEIDEAISAWTRERTDEECFDMLEARGIPAGPVRSMLSVRDDPHLTARGFLETIEHPEGGDWRVTSPVWRLASGRAQVRLPAPTFGRDTRAVLTGVLGLTDREIDELEREGVTAPDPIPVTP